MLLKCRRLRARRELTAVARDDAGVVAIVVALSVSTFLLGFAALAVDLGQAYLRQTEVQGLADRLAMAGAAQLPDVAAARAAVHNTLLQICTDEKIDGICTDDGSGSATADTNWESNASPDDGQLRFFADQGQAGPLADLNTPAGLDPGDALGAGATEADGIQVVLPPSKVTFGFAGAFGANSAQVVKTATARIGTPLGAGLLPFALTPTDLARGQFCVRDPLARGVPTPWPTRGPLHIASNAERPFFDPAPPPLTVDPAGGDITVFLNGNGAVVLGEPQFFIRGEDGNPDRQIDPRDVTKVRGQQAWTVTMPPETEGTTVEIYAKGTYFRFPRNRSFTTPLAPVTYGDPAVATNDLCNQPSALRGVLALSRPGLRGANAIEQNIRQSPAVKLYQATSPLAGLIGNTLDCLSLTFPTAKPSSTCLSTKLDIGFATEMTNGLLSNGGTNTPGRMTRDCGSGTMDVRGRSVDASQLVSGDNQKLLDDSNGNGTALRNNILRGGAPVEGWVKSAALKCGRLVMLPVIDPLTGPIGGENIMRFTYAWIDGGSSRGLNWRGNKVESFQGYVIDPRYLPASVAGSPLVGPYLGPNLPKEALLIHDVGAPAT